MLITFVVYFVFLLGIGFYFYRKSVSIEDYLLGGVGDGTFGTGERYERLELDAYMYEIVPGFICNCLAIFLVNTFVEQQDEKVLRQYEEVVEEITAG